MFKKYIVDPLWLYGAPDTVILKSMVKGTEQEMRDGRRQVDREKELTNTISLVWEC